MPIAATAADYYVETPANGGSDANTGTDWATAKATIQAAVNLATGVGDRVLVAEGTYTERVTFPSHNNFQLLGGYPTGGGTQAPWTNVTIIDGTGSSGTVLSIGLVDGSNGYNGLVLDGFTIQNGNKDGAYGAGIQSFSVDLTIRRCVVQNNTNTNGYVGGIYVAALLNESSIRTLKIEETIVRDNSGPYGGGILIDSFGYPSIELTNSLIYGNSATVTDGLYSTGGVTIGTGAQDVNSVKITNCTIAANSASHSTSPVGGITVNLNYSPNVIEVKNSIIWNTQDDIYDYGGGGANILISYSDISDSGDTGTGVIHTDPAFVSGSDYHLTSSSGDCIDGGTASGAPSIDLEGIIRPQGSGDDMGAYEYIAPAGTQYTLTTSVVSGNGTLAPPTGDYDEGTIVTLTASPDTGYQIAVWTGTDNDSLTGSGNTVTLDSDKSVSVEFELIPIYLTTSVTDGHGTISPESGLQTEDALVELTTVPDAGYQVIAWSGTDKDSSITSNNFVTMDSSKTVTVEFGPIPFIRSETRVMDMTQVYYTNEEWAVYSAVVGTNLFCEADGTLHMAIVDNYELWYFRSEDNGKSWSKEKLPTSLDGKVRYAVITVDRNGKVFIGFTSNPAYNYGNTGVSGTNVYRFDVHSVTDESGSWVVSDHFTSTSGFGYFVSGMAVDGDNNVHIFATRYGWGAEGGDAREWVWDNDTGIWGDYTTVCHFDSTLGSNKIIRWYTSALVDSNGDITVVMKRYTNSNTILFYVSNSGGSWGTPVNIDADTDPSWDGLTTFDAAIDKNDVIHLVYNTNNSIGQTETVYSSDLGGTSKTIFTASPGQKLYDLKIHSDGEGNLTTILRRESAATVLIKKPADGSWESAEDLPTTVPAGNVSLVMVAQSDTFAGSFTDCKLGYFGASIAAPPRPATPPYGPYGSYTIYYNDLLSKTFPWTIFLPAILEAGR